jgi:hypothetical protein
MSLVTTRERRCMRYMHVYLVMASKYLERPDVSNNIPQFADMLIWHSDSGMQISHHVSSDCTCLILVKKLFAPMRCTLPLSHIPTTCSAPVLHSLSRIRISVLSQASNAVSSSWRIPHICFGHVRLSMCLSITNAVVNGFLCLWRTLHTYSSIVSMADR